MNFNPYASPASTPTDPGMISQFMSSRRLVAILARWTLICTVSAAPSFSYGCFLHHQPQHILGMIAGVVVFILGYTLVEASAAYRRVIRWRHVRTMVWIGYGTRVAISIIFPFAIVIDVWTGMLSVLIVNPGYIDGKSGAGFLSVFLTTLVQGTFLNVVLLAYMGVVWCILWLAAKLWRRGDDARRENYQS